MTGFCRAERADLVVLLALCGPLRLSGIGWTPCAADCSFDRIGVAQKCRIASMRRVMRLPIQAPKRGESIQPLRDLDTVRAYLSGPGPTAFFDLPWVPLYLAVCFAFHFWIGVTVLAGALVLVSLTLLSELLAKQSALDANRIGNQRARLAETSRRNAEALTALGMVRWISRRWQSLNRKFLSGHAQSSDLSAGLAPWDGHSG